MNFGRKHSPRIRKKFWRKRDCGSMITSYRDVVANARKPKGNKNRSLDLHFKILILETANFKQNSFHKMKRYNKKFFHLLDVKVESIGVACCFYVYFGEHRTFMS